MKAALVVALGTLFFSAASFAQLSVAEPWVRATVPAQKATGGFMHLKSEKDGSLLGAETPVAALVEIHEMRMEGDMMRMRQVNTLKLPAGRTVSLQPGSYHLMLLELKQPLQAGMKIPLTLRFQQSGKAAQSLHVEAEVRSVDGGHMRH